MQCTSYLYADDTSIYMPIDPCNPAVANIQLQNDLVQVSRWAHAWKLKFKSSKSCDVIFTKSGTRNYNPLMLVNEIIPQQSYHKHLGFILDKNLNFTEHVNYIAEKVQRLLNPLKALSYKLKSCHLNTIYSSFIRPYFDYGDILFASANMTSLKRLDRLQYNAALIVSGCIHGSNTNKVLACLNWKPLSDRRKERQQLYMFKVFNNMVPNYVAQIFNGCKNIPNQRVLRNTLPYRIPQNSSAKIRHSPSFQLMDTWNRTEQATRSIPTFSQFKSKVRYAKSSNVLSSTSVNNMNRKEELCLNRLRVDLLLKGHLYSHNFVDVRDPMCNFCNEFVGVKHFFIKCQQPYHKAELRKLLLGLENIHVIDHFNALSQTDKCTFLLYGDPKFSFATNSHLLKLTSKFILENYKKL